MAENRLKGPPVEAGEERTVEITGLGHAGEGVGRIDDLAVFVPGAIPGDLVNIEVAEVKRRYGRGRILKLVRPAPERIAPPLSDCGGLRWVSAAAYGLWCPAGMEAAAGGGCPYSDRQVSGT